MSLIYSFIIHKIPTHRLWIFLCFLLIWIALEMFLLSPWTAWSWSSEYSYAYIIFLNYATLNPCNISLLRLMLSKQNCTMSPLYLRFLFPHFTLFLVQQVSHQQQPHHQVQSCSLSAQPNVPAYACTSCSPAARAAPSSHAELPGSPAAPGASFAVSQGWRAVKGCTWGFCCPISWRLTLPVALKNAKRLP